MHQHGESRPRQTELLGTRPHTLGSQGLAPLAKWLSTGSSSAMPKSNPPRIAPSSLDSFGRSWEEPKFEDRKQTVDLDVHAVGAKYFADHIHSQLVPLPHQRLKNAPNRPMTPWLVQSARCLFFYRKGPSNLFMLCLM
jgi:hypothetical protein